MTFELAAVRQGNLRKHEKFSSRFLSDDRDLIVYLPPGYDAQADRRFPVLYLQDGQNLFDGATSFVPGMDWRVGHTADRLIAAGSIEALLIVGIYNTARRIDEYTPARDGKLGGGAARLYGRMLLEEILPFIDSQYRVLSRPESTGLGGSSLGGLLALYLGLRFPERFGKLAVLSPSVWWNRRWILAYARRARLRSLPRIWLDIGTAEEGHIVEDVRRLRQILVEKGWQEGRDLLFQVIQGGRHNEAAWAQRVGPFLQFLFPGGEAQAPPPSARHLRIRRESRG